MIFFKIVKMGKMETAQFSCNYFIIESCLYSEEEGNTQLYSVARIQPNLLTTVGEGLVNGALLQL